MFSFLRQEPLSKAEHTEYEQPIIPAFGFYFYGLSCLVALLSPVSLEGPLLIGFALLPRLNRGANTVLTPAAVLALTFLVRAVACILGVIKTGGLLIANWPLLEKAVATSRYYPGASPLLVNLILGAGVVMACIFVIENAEVATRGFLREWATSRKI